MKSIKYNWKELSKELDEKIESCFELPFSKEIIQDRVKNFKRTHKYTSK